MTLSSKQIRLVVALAGANLVLVVAGWLLLVSPQRSHAHSASQQLQQVQSEVSHLGSSAGTKPPPVKQPTIRTAGLYRLEQAMPTGADESDLLLMLDQLAHNSGVKVLQLSLNAPAAAVGYVTLPAQLTLTGTYSSLTRYLRRMRTLVAMRHGSLVSHGRLLAVTSVSMHPGGKGGDLSATVGLNAYVYGTVNGVAPLSTAATSTSTSSTSTTSTTTSTTSG